MVMGNNPENMIKARIAETIVEELFRDLGFYVLKFGKENTINPLVNLESFIKACKGQFKLQKEDHKFIYPVSYINKLPDFIVVGPTGQVEFIEVKFRHDGCLWPKDEEVFSIFPETTLVVVNLVVSDRIIEVIDEEDKSALKLLKTARFHVWQDESLEEKEQSIVACTLAEWLKIEFDMADKKSEEKYEKLVSKWLSE